ncbi:hypothetical protein NR798_37145 [Archangium gephyra]|uniref:hypothetical protein n=1 Tax=Archangium gephyra TaxID=48 RepID=UPI0035D490A2
MGPNVSKDCKPGERLPTEERGFYTLSVIDRQKRTFEVTLRGENAHPPAVSDAQKGRVVLDYRVEV